MAKFTLKELLKTSTGISNIPNDIEKDNLDILLRFLNKIGVGWDQPVYVTSGYRCKAVNKAVGGVDSSHHTLGLAADLTCKDVVEFKDYIKANWMDEVDQLIYYPKKNFIHISIHSKNRKMYLEK